MRLKDHISGLGFMKMHGLGNDFVVIDGREGGPPVTAALARAIGDRHRGVGFDQLAVISDDSSADVSLTFFNADGSHSAACGNATRCIARHEMDARGVAFLTLRTERGILQAEDAGDGMTRVNMGEPLLAWNEIPLSEERPTDHLPIDGDPIATGMGNPHCTFFVEDAEALDISAFGRLYETHPLFPERTNVEAVQVLSRTALRVRIWERGTGVTLASGSCSCAAVVAAVRRGLIERRADVHVDGGTLTIDWREDGVWMTGPTMHVFTGELTPEFLASL